MFQKRGWEKKLRTSHHSCIEWDVWDGFVENNIQFCVGVSTWEFRLSIAQTSALVHNLPGGYISLASCLFLCFQVPKLWVLPVSISVILWKNCTLGNLLVYLLLFLRMEAAVLSSLHRILVTLYIHDNFFLLPAKPILKPLLLVQPTDSHFTHCTPYPPATPPQTVCTIYPFPSETVWLKKKTSIICSFPIFPKLTLTEDRIPMKPSTSIYVERSPGPLFCRFLNYSSFYRMCWSKWASTFELCLWTDYSQSLTLTYIDWQNVRPEDTDGSSSSLPWVAWHMFISVGCGMKLLDRLQKGVWHPPF